MGALSNVQSRLPRRLAAGAALAVLLAGCGGDDGNWLDNASPFITSSAGTTVAASPPNVVPDDKLEKLANDIQSNLNYKNLDGLLRTVCESGRSGQAKQDLLAAFPALDPGHPEHGVKVHFDRPEVKAAQKEGYLLRFTGGYPTQPGRSVQLVLKAYLDAGVASWCGMSSLS
ncbi:hypothetical protein [Amycolatopsis suaedae]|uniref:Uncharacterized protein n=1 Tax=Amycolatopsis suaedae TaxID=2510978 RepID=A0A4Q7J435_9PSEU|nr:hypothetical protein [Amycolatopsis suaedae]RZQ60744.1 hypothetical protein EWH70_26910 [Amycolatopsis suaedae]